MNYLKNNNIISWKNKFIIAWLNKKADINSKYQQLLEQINQLQDENKKLQLIKLLNIIKSTCSNIENKYKDETLDFLFNKSKKDENLLKNENNLKYTLSHALDNIKTYFFMKEKNIKGLPNFLRNIENFIELENIVNNFSKELEKYSNKVSGEILNISQNYKKAEFNDINGNCYEIFKIPQSNKQKHIDALRVLAHGKKGYQNGIFNEKNAEGRWCVLQENMAKHYLSQDNFYVVYKNVRVFAGLGNQDFNCVNRINKQLNIHEWAILLKPFLNIDKELIENKFNNKYKELYDYVVETNNSGEIWFKDKLKNSNNMEEIIDFCLKYKYRYKNKENNIIKYLSEKKDIENLYKYAKNCMKKRFKQNDIGKKAEKLITQSAEYAYGYTKNCLPNKQWDENTEIGKIALTSIAQNAECAYLYAYYFLSNKKWDENTEIGKLALTNIAKNAEFAYEYAYNCLPNHRWNENTKYGKIALNNIAKKTKYAYEYAIYCLPNKKWDENTKFGKIALATIAKNAKYAYEYAYEYAYNCLPNKQWDENTEIGKIALNTIAKNAKYAYLYGRYRLPYNKQWDENTEIGQLALITIINSSKYAYEYAYNCLPNHQWNENSPIGQLAIKTLKNSIFWNDYCKLSGI